MAQKVLCWPEMRPSSRCLRDRGHVSGADYAAVAAARVIEAVSQPYLIEGHAVSVATSAGVSIYPDHGEDADTLMKSADLALYEAKRAGKNAYRISQG